MRKIDFNYDHFPAAYGPNGDGVGNALVAVSRPQITRSIEQIAGAVTPLEAAIKASGTFYGLGSSALIDPPGDVAATFYEPSADFSMNGNPEIVGAIVSRNFYASGNISWHCDRALDCEGDAVDYRVASYVEAVR